MKFVVRSVDTGKLYGPFNHWDQVQRWVKTKKFSSGYQMIPLKAVTIPRKPVRWKRRVNR